MLQKLGQRIKNQKGLTLIELLAVIVILGIIAAIAIPSIGSVIQKSRVDAVKSDAIQVINSAKIFVSSNGVPSDNTIDKADLVPDYTEKVGLADDFVVTVSGSEYTITATGAAGSKTVTITGASVSDLNAKTSTKVVTD